MVAYTVEKEKEGVYVVWPFELLVGIAAGAVETGHKIVESEIISVVVFPSLDGQSVT